MKRHLTLSILVLLALASAASAESDKTFGMLIAPYEAVRQALLHDTVENVAEKAAEMRQIAVESAGDEDLKELMTKLSKAAGQLAEASDLGSARQAFYELSKLMVQVRSKVGGENRTVVVYCSMKKMSWLQPKGDIGNPYYGQSMAACGEVVDE